MTRTVIDGDPRGTYPQQPLYREAEIGPGLARCPICGRLVAVLYSYLGEDARCRWCVEAKKSAREAERR